MTSTVSIQNEDDIELLRYGRFVASYWQLIVACAAAGAVIAAVVALTRPVVYEASATMTVATATTGTPLSLTPATSRALLANLTLVAQTLKEAGIDGMSPQEFVDDALTIQPIPTTSLIRVSVSLPDPTKARLAADILSRKAIDLSTHLDQDGAIAARDALKTQVDEAGRRFSEAAARVSAFETAHHMERRKAEAKALFKQQGDLARAAADLDVEKSRLSVLEREAGAPAATRSADRATVTVADGDGQTPAVSLPLADALRYQAAESRAKIAALDRRRREAEAGGDPDTNKRVDEMYRLGVESDRLHAESDATKRVYGDLTAKYAEAAGRVAGHSAQLLLVDPPVQPDRPMSKQPVRWALLGAIAGFAFGVVAALIVNRRRNGQVRA